MKNKEIIIVGAGWAGLAAALELSNAGFKITLFESAPQAGGRARSILLDNHVVDNGQHVMIGAYQELLRLLTQLGIQEQSVFERTPLFLHLLSSSKQSYRLRLPKLFSPANLVAGVLLAQNFSINEKLQALRFCLAVQKINFLLDDDMTVRQFLEENCQSQTLNQNLWEPLCLAALTTPATQASAQLFLNVLRDTFKSQQKNSDWLIPTVPLGDLFPKPAIQHLQTKGHKIIYNHRVAELKSTNHNLTAIVTKDKSFSADHYIIATHPHACSKLTQSVASLSTISKQLSQMSYETITTAYFKYSKKVVLSDSIIGILNRYSQWLFHRYYQDSGQWLSVVISGCGPHDHMSKTELASHIESEIAGLIPSLGEPLQSWVVKEKKAAFTASPEYNKLRPQNQTPLNNCWLAGDYTQTGYPATLEGAIRSGVQCAQEIIDYERMAT